MNNKFERLFISLTKLMTAEKMKLDRFCQQGEYLAYKVSVPNQSTIDENVKFVFSVYLENSEYTFSEQNLDNFNTFEDHLSLFLNELFERKQTFETQRDLLDNTLTKITNILSTEEQQCLATHIDTKTDILLQTLGVIPHHNKY